MPDIILKMPISVIQLQKKYDYNNGTFLYWLEQMSPSTCDRLLYLP